MNTNINIFDINKIPTFKAVEEYKGKYLYTNRDEFLIISNNDVFNNMQISNFQYDNSMKFEPCKGWKGHIEINPTTVS